MKWLWGCLLLCIGITAGPLPASNLLLEYLPSPVLGLDVPFPRFSWQVSHTVRGQNQSSYELVVFRAPATVVWNSGRVNTSQTSQVVYAGQELQSDTSYSWQVTWWDSDGSEAQVSQPAYFDTGIFNQSLWIGKWIGGANQLRKEFTLPLITITRARLFISGLGYYVARINGNRVGDYVLGPWTQYEYRVFYDVYDVASLISPGSNAIAVALGPGFYGDQSVNMGNITVICQLSVAFSDGSHQWVALTDFTWKVVNGPVTYASVYRGENYDARLATPGWDKPGFDDSNWTAASPAVPTPVGKLQAHLLYPQKKIETFSPVNSWEPYPGVYVFDFGQNMAGWSQIRAIGPSGTMITIQHSEMVNVATRQLQNMFINAPMIDNFTLAGTGDWEYFEPEFVFHGFQYIQLNGYPGVPALESVQAFFIHSALPDNGNFLSSNDVINYADHMTRTSAISNYQSIPSDCPTREKRGWLGDAQVSAEVQMQYWDMGAAYTKFVQDIHDSQTKIGTGVVGDTAPWYSWGSIPADPAWGSAFALIWYWSYVYYNDTRMLSTHYEAVKWYVASLTEQSSSNGLLEWSRYGDWCAVANGTTSCFYNSSVVSSFYYISQLDILQEVSALLGYTNDTEYYTKLATYARAQFNPAYFNSTSFAYNWGYQTLQVLPIVAGLVPDSQFNNVVNYLLNDIMNKHDGHLTVGIVGAKYLLDTLTAIGRADVAWTVATQTGFPSWYGFASQGGTTLWEEWPSTRGTTYGTRNHIMFGGQATWYYRTLAGITMTPGTIAYEDITIDPKLIYETNLSYATASINTYKGLIYSNWYRDIGVCSSAPETRNATLVCASGVITKIDFASFGAIPFGTCGSYTANPSCNANTTMQIVSKMCLGKSSCSILSSTAIFGDPCDGTPKHLTIQVSGCDIAPYNLETSIPFNTLANVVVSKFSLSNVSITENNAVVWQNNQYLPNSIGILHASDLGDAVNFRVGGGNFKFQVFGSEGTPLCISLKEGDVFTATCPHGLVMSRVKHAHFGTGVQSNCNAGNLQGGCSIGSTKHVMEHQCLFKNHCSFDLIASLFGDLHHSICGSSTYFLTTEIMCS